jgi:lysophospholipid acyltransferase (LPLAT)-like uncharacterized protein
LVRLWGWSLRIERVNATTFFDPELQARRPVIILWHDEIFPLIPALPMLAWPAWSAKARTESSWPRCWSALALPLMRGSSSRGGLRALIVAKRFMDKTGKGLFSTADGPRGPRHRIQPGAIFLAEHADRPLSWSG